MTDVDPYIYSPIAHARFDSLGETIVGLLNDSRDPPDAILHLLTALLGNAVGAISPADKIDSAVELIAEQVAEVARAYQADPPDLES